MGKGGRHSCRHCLFESQTCREKTIYDQSTEILNSPRARVLYVFSRREETVEVEKGFYTTTKAREAGTIMHVLVAFCL